MNTINLLRLWAVSMTLLLLGLLFSLWQSKPDASAFPQLVVQVAGDVGQNLTEQRDQALTALSSPRPGVLTVQKDGKMQNLPVAVQMPKMGLSFAQPARIVLQGLPKSSTVVLLRIAPVKPKRVFQPPAFALLRPIVPENPEVPAVTAENTDPLARLWTPPILRAPVESPKPVIRPKPVQASFLPPQAVHQVLPTLDSGLAWGVPTQKVYVLVSVTETGSVGQARIERGSGLLNPQARQAVLQAARQWRFTPARLNGKPVGSQHELVFNFRGK